MSTLQIITARRHVSKARIKTVLKYSGLFLLFSPVIVYNTSRNALSKVLAYKPVASAISAVRKAYNKLFKWGRTVASSAESELERAAEGLVTAHKEYCNECRAALEQVHSQEYKDAAIASAIHEAKAEVQRDIEAAKRRLREALAAL